MAAHGLLCQSSFSYSWEKLQLGSSGPEHSIFISTIKSSLLQVPLLTLFHFMLCCHLMRSSPSCKNLILFYVRVQISIQLNPLLLPSPPKIKNERGCFTTVERDQPMITCSTIHSCISHIPSRLLVMLLLC